MPIDRAEIRKWDIYRITSPAGKIYIGLTSNMRKRMSVYKYIHNSGSRQTLIYNSVRKYGWENHKVDVIDTFRSNVGYANGKEMFWIKTYMSNRNKYPEQNGLNLNDGGGTNIGYKPKPESIEKSRLRKIGTRASEETKKKMSDSQKGKKMNFTHMTPEFRKMVSERNKGYKHTPESLKKISEASKISNKGRVLSVETKEKLRQANLGKKYSAETKAKLSAMRKGKKIKSGWTPERRQKMRELKLASGFKHTEEAKRKISEAGKGNKYNVGRKQSPEEIEKRRQVNLGNKYNLGRKQSPEVIEKRISKIRGRKRVVNGFKIYHFKRKEFNLKDIYPIISKAI